MADIFLDAFKLQIFDAWLVAEATIMPLQMVQAGILDQYTNFLFSVLCFFGSLKETFEALLACIKRC